MKLFVKLGLLAVIVVGFGCSKSDQPQTIDATGPLTVEQWKELPTAEKYDERSFERLRENDKELQTQAGWDKFMKEVVVPERKKEIPGTPGEKP